MKIKIGLIFIAWMAINSSTVLANPFPRFSSFSATVNDAAAGKTANYTITFVTSDTVAVDGKFTVNFPGKFNLASVSTGSIISGLDGGLIVTNHSNFGNDEGNYVTLTRDGAGTQKLPGTQLVLQFNGVVNSDSTGVFELVLRHFNSSDIATATQVTIVPDVLDHFTVTNTTDGPIASQTAGTNFSSKFTAYDQYGNIATNWTGTINLSDATGSFSPATTSISTGGTITISNANITTAMASTSITATFGSVIGSSNTFTVNPAAIDHFTVTDTSDGPIATQTAGTNFSSKFTAYDQYGNIATNWTGTINLSDATGSFSPATTSISTGGTITISNANITTATASTSITATFGSATGSSNTFTVNPAALDSFTITNASNGNIGDQTSAETFTIKLTAYDQYGNIKTDYLGSPALTVNKGDVSPSSVTFIANGILEITNTVINTANTGVVVSVTDGGVISNSNAFNVLVGPVVEVKILKGTSGENTVLTGKSITTDSLITAHAAGFDAGNNYVQDEAVTWALSNTSLGRLSVSSGVSTTFDPRKPGSGELQVNQGGTGLSAGSGDYIVFVGEVQNIKVLTGASGETSEQGNQSIAAGSTLTVHAGGYDSDFNYVQDESVSWSVIGGIGSMPVGPSTSAVFTSTTSGTGLIKADHNSTEVIDAYSGTITVGVGGIDHVILRTATDGSGTVFSTYNMTADQSVTIYAAGYDANNNFIGNQSVTWSAPSGSFSPGTGSSTVYSPTLAANVTVVGTPASGTAASAIITVTAGVPTGSIVLTPGTSTLAADGISETTITSSTIVDADGNNVGANHQFTVSLGNSSMGQILNDVNLSLPGVQIATNASSKLSFIFRAGTLGGTTSVFASSVNGSADGSTQLTLTSMRIVSLSTASSTVSRGQQDAQISLTVENNGSQDITITSANPTFTHASDGITKWTGFENITRTNPEVTVIPASGGSVALTFNVDITTGATIDSVIVDGIVNGTVSGVSVRDSAATNRPPRWIVQKNPAAVSVVSVSAPDAIVDQGSAGHTVSVVVNIPSADAETANAVIDDVTLKFKANNTDVSSGYIVAPVNGNPTVIPGSGGNIQLDYLVDVLSQAQTGLITLDAVLTAHDANSGLQLTDLDGASASDSWTVENSESVAIVSVTPSQAKVNAGMTKQWTVSVVVDNSSSSTVNVNSLDLRFFAGAVEKTSEYTITPPALTAIAPNSQANYTYTVTRTGTSTGTITIDVHFLGSDGSPIDLTNSNNTFAVQTAAAVAIKEIIAPATATINQTTAWRAKVVLQNTGEANAEVNFNADSTKYLFSNVAGYSITRPTLLASGKTFIAGSSEDTLSFVVNTTGSTPGALSIGAIVRGYDKNSNVVFRDSTIAEELRTVTIQTPASIKIDSTWISSLNAPSVNRLQEFQVISRIKNDGQESLDSVVIDLSSSEISSPSTFALHSAAFTIPGGSAINIPITVTAADRSGSETFTVSVFSAKGKNTKKIVSPLAALDSSEQAILQTAAELQVVSVVPSPETVFANQLIPWTITATVKNNGEATAQLKPKATDINFDLDSHDDTQNYNINAPVTANLPGNGQETEIVYTINRTGILSGTANITLTLGATDANTGATISGVGNTTKLIEENSSVLIIKSEMLAPNIQNANAIVNTGQSFTIRVSVKNNGVDAVRDAIVRLQDQFAGGAFSEVKDTIATIQPNEVQTIDFLITAGSVQNDVGERVIAYLDTATVITSGNGANIGEPINNEVKFITQVPAELQVKASTNFTYFLLQKEQEFLFTASISNRGQAGLSGSGQLRLDLPVGYGFSTDSVQTNEVSFDMNSPKLTWRLVSPSTNSTVPGGDPVGVRFLGTPTDINSGTAAATFKAGDTLYYSVGNLEFAIDSVRIISPQGAAENNKVSSGSTFRLKVFLHGWRRLMNSTASLVLPTGFSFSGTSAETIPVSPVDGNYEAGYVEWDITAPATATETETKAFTVRIQGVDGAGISQSNQTQFSCDLVPKALLSLALDGGISTNLSLAMGQTYDLKVVLRNTGSAGISGDAVLRIDTTNSEIKFTSTPAQNDTLTGVRVGDINTWKLQMPDAAMQTSIRVNLLDPRPNDIYTGQPAAVVPGGDELHINISVRETGAVIADNFVIFEPVGAIDNIISTDQQFKIRAKLSGQDVKDVSLTLQQTSGSDFTIENATRQPNSIETFNSIGETYEWLVMAPANAAKDTFAVFWEYKDATSGDAELSGKSQELVVTTVKKASYSFTAEIVAPASALDRIVSPNQNFIIDVELNKLGTANLHSGTDINIRLKTLPPGYGTTSPDVQSLGTFGGVVSWNIIAPDSRTETENIEFELFDLPLDENSGQAVGFSQTSAAIPVRTRSGQLELRELNVESSSVVAEGQEVELLRLGFTNKGDEFASLIDLLSLKVDVLNEDKEALVASEVLETFTAKLLFEDGSEIPVNTVLNPVNLNEAWLESVFQDTIKLTPDSLNVLAFSCKLKANSSGKKFSLRITEKAYISAQDHGSQALIGLELVDKYGNARPDLQISSPEYVVVGSELSTNFFNYPNPFNPNSQRTLFSFTLQQAAEVTIDIYTLFGEHVYHKTYPETDPAGIGGGAARTIEWDGRNGTDQVVLSGIYVAYIKAGSNIAKTTVAVIR
ncbi:MAG: S-layer family protein [Deferribacteres bacterium]|nr:S-layer family protein [candidate division KSB1 bacterium]MCB9502945.1 S-layer family protein [Deferribacteres bacterium]